MSILELLLWVGVAVIIFRMFFKPTASQPAENTEIADEQHLTETQRRWRQMKRDQELETMMASASEHATKYERIIRLQVEMQQYILDNKRPFHLGVWLFDSIDPRLLTEYCKYMAVVFGVFFLVSITGWSTLLTIMFALNVFTTDFLIYRKQLMLEVTAWNPEFQEKYAKEFEKLTRGMDIP